MTPAAAYPLGVPLISLYFQCQPEVEVSMSRVSDVICPATLWVDSLSAVHLTFEDAEISIVLFEVEYLDSP